MALHSDTFPIFSFIDEKKLYTFKQILCTLEGVPKDAVAPLAWVPWVPGNPSIFEQWVPETINLGEKGLNSTLFSV